MGDMDREDAKSLDSSDGAVLPEERSENHSSVSDMVHLEMEESELLEEEEEADLGVGEEVEEVEEEMQSSVLSVLGGERELAELRGELMTRGLASRGLQEEAAGSAGILVSVEEAELPVHRVPSASALPHLHVVTPSIAMPIVKLQPPSATSTPVKSAPTDSEIAEHLSSMQELHPPPVLPPTPPEVEGQTDDLSESSVFLPAGEEPPRPDVPVKAEPKAPISSPPTQLPALLCGGAALVAIVGVAAYGAIAYSRK